MKKTNSDCIMEQVRLNMTNLIPLTLLFGDTTHSHWISGFAEWIKFIRKPYQHTTNFEVLSQISIDLTLSDKDYTIHIEIPGVKQENIRVKIDGNFFLLVRKLSRRKRKTGKSFCKYLHVPGYHNFLLESNVDEAKSKVRFENSKLELILPKKKKGDYITI